MAGAENRSYTAVSDALQGTLSRPSTSSGPESSSKSRPDTVGSLGMHKSSRPQTIESLGILKSRPGTNSGTIWTVEGDDILGDGMENKGFEGDGDCESISPSTNSEVLNEEDTRILLEKEFDDYHEDRVHKAAGPMIFCAKSMGMLPAIWTDDETENECKSYFNLYTFVLFLSWYAMAIGCGFRIHKMDMDLGESGWPNQEHRVGNQTISERRFFSRLVLDGYVGCLFSNAIIATSFTIFKCTRFAEMLYTISEVDSQLELKEKHYEKIKTKTQNWVTMEVILTASHFIGMLVVLENIQRDVILVVAIFLGNLPIAVLDLMYVHMCMVLAKRYRMLNKIMSHVTAPFKTFRQDEPSHEMLQKILSYRWEAVKKEEASKTFDQIWEPSENDNVELDDNNQPQNKAELCKLELPPALFMKNKEQEISRDEETTVILQLDILRGIHSDLHHVGQEINYMLGIQLLVTLCTSTVLVIIFGFFTFVTLMDGRFYWPFLCIFLTPCLRILFIGHWAQVIKDTSMKPFWTMSQMSTLDGSPKLERQVQKLGLQTAQKAARISAAGYFYVDRNIITRILGVSILFIFLLIKFDRVGNKISSVGFYFNMTEALELWKEKND